jgi:hypothetical protein
MSISEIKPIKVDQLDVKFGRIKDLLPPMKDIPSEFKRYSGAWCDWQSDWFYSDLKCYPVPKEGIDLNDAMKHLAAIQSSWEPKHEHKSAGVAYLASLWFSSPDGEPIKPKQAA